MGKITSILYLLLNLFTFADADLCLDGDCNNDGDWETNAWYAQVDGVMGGRSTGYLDFIESDSTMLFYGNININGGGFSSVRRSFIGPRVDLSPYAGIVITMDSLSYDGDSIEAPLGMHLQFGDGQRWRFAAPFAIPLSGGDDETTSVFIPIESIDRGSRIGFVCTNGCRLDPSRVNSMDLYVLFQEGNFRVNIHSIEAVDEAVSFPSPQVSFSSSGEIVNLLTETISSGSALYNYNYVELCYSVYWSTLNTILESPSTSEVTKGVICAGLLHTTTQEGEKDNIAWTLRRTIDAVIEDLEDNDSREEQFDWLPVGDDAISFADQCRGITSLTFDSSMFAAEESSEDDEDNDVDVGVMCFPEHALVEEATKGIIPMRELEIGDFVLDASGSFSQVYGFGHKDLNTPNVEYLELIFDHHGNQRTLHISSSHFIFVLGGNGTSKVAIPASDVEVGDIIFLERHGSTIAKVSDISVSYNSTGAYAPFTFSGTLLVNQVAESSYANFGSVRTSHAWAHFMLAPRRWLCRVAMESWCRKEDYNSRGIATWIPMQIAGRAWKLLNAFLLVR